MVVLLLLFWGLSQYIPGGQAIYWQDWSMETSLAQRDEGSRQLVWEKILINAHKSCNYVFYGPNMELNGAPLGERVIKALNTKALAPQLDEKLKNWGMDRGQVESFVQKICQEDPLQAPKDKAAPQGIIADLKLRNEVLTTMKSLLNSLPDTSQIPQIKSSQIHLKEDNWGINNPMPFDQTINLSVNESVLANSCLKKRNWIPYKSIPPLLVKAFMAAEDKDFYNHNGVSFAGLMRAALKKGGGSTITLQTIKNLYFQCNLKDGVTPIENIPPRWQRKIKEFILARSVEETWGKDKIIEAYLNIIYFGNGAEGIYEASKKYFNKNLNELTLEEMSLLAAIPQNPNILTRSSEFARLLERSSYVLGQMKENKWIDEATQKKHEGQTKSLGYFASTAGFSESHYVSSLVYDLKKQKMAYPEKTTVVSQISSPLQSFVQTELIEGLLRYQMKAGAPRIKPIVNLLAVHTRLKNEEVPPNTPPPDSMGLWRDVLSNYKIIPPLDTWRKALVLGVTPQKSLKVLVDNLGEVDLVPQVFPETGNGQWTEGDVFWVKETPPAKGKKVSSWQIQFLPQVEGAAVVMDAHTGAVYAIASSNSFRNNALQAWRQPGSTLKPFTYLYALENGVLPADLVADRPVTLPPISGNLEAWSPKNYEDTSYKDYPMRIGLELSKNLMTVNLLKVINRNEPYKALDGVRQLTQIFGIYPETLVDSPNANLSVQPVTGNSTCLQEWDCGLGEKGPLRFYPFVLGAQETNLINVANAYAQIANGGYKTKPSFIKKIIDESNGSVLYEHGIKNQKLPIKDSSLNQLTSMMMGVVQRGTAKSAAHLYPFVAGKTGTSNDQRDAWFVGFSSSLVVGVWVGYGIPENLGKGQTGGTLALPIVDRIFTKLFAVDDAAEKGTALPGNLLPSFKHQSLLTNATQGMIALKFDRYSGCYLGDELQSPYEDGEVEELVDAKKANQLISAGPSIQCLQKRYFTDGEGGLTDVNPGTED